MIEQNISLKPFNTFGIEAKTAKFCRFSSIQELENLREEILSNQLLILGGGSNLLLTKDFTGLVLKNEIKGIEIESEDAEEIILKVGAGEVWHEFVLYCVEKNYAGIENLSLIPGSVGASPMQNIGAYGVEIKDVFEKLSAYHIETGEINYFNKNECNFAYRESVFKKVLKGKYIISHVYFRLKKEAAINSSYGAIEQVLNDKGIKNPTIKDVSDAVISIRQSKLPDPKVLGNAGSFFKNPVVEIAIYQKILENYPAAPSYPAENGKVKVPAGWLIETAGWKGKNLGTHGVHDRQALVLVNYGNATGKEIWDLSSAVLKDVKNKFGIDLEREVNII
jgi:UDP-N-acetylmuramate dehydrogenase